MSKVFEDSKHEQLKKMFVGDSSSYVLITCGEPSRDGNMDVEMSYKGDPDLISYLIRDAENHLG